MKQLLVYYIVLSMIFSPLMAIKDINTNEKPNYINRTAGKKSSNPSLPNNNNGESLSQNIKNKNKTDYESDLDLNKYKKVSLFDVVLETVSKSELLKASREKVVQSELKLKSVVAKYYPTLNFEYKTSRSLATDTAPDANYKYYNDRNYKFVLNQSIYSGGAISNEIKSLDKKLDVSKNQYTITLSEQVQKAVKAYFNVVFSHRTVVVNQRNMEKLNRILDIVSIKYDNGALSIGDLTAIKASVSNAKTKLIRVRSKLTEALRYYEYIAGIEFIETLPYEKNFKIDISTFDLLYERALERNKGLVNYYKTIESEKLKLKNKNAAFSPKLDFELTYNNVMDKDGFTQREEVLSGQFKVSYNIFNGGKDKNKILEVYSVIRETLFKLNEEKKKLKWNISKVYTSLTSTKDSISSQLSEVVASRKMVEAYWEGFKLGEQDLQVLLNGQKQLNTAEIELIKQEASNITDFFTLLANTGDLLAFFDIDPIHEKFIDFAKSSYNKDLYIDDKFLDEKERLKRAKQEEEKIALNNTLIAKAKQEENIKKFSKEFMKINDNNYTIDIGEFKNTIEANKYIKVNSLDKLSFAYDTIKGYALTSKIAYGNYEDKKEALAEIKALKTNKNITKSLEAIKVADVKKLYKDYLSGLEVIVEPTPPEIKIIEKIKTIEKIKKEKEIKKFALDDSFKKEFLNANEKMYTINISSFSSMKEVENLIDENKSLYNKAFAFNYIDINKLVRLMYGLFDSYEEASSALDSFPDIKKKYYPVIEKVRKQQEIYKDNEKLNKIEKKKPNFEYIKISSKTEYKELNNVEDKDLQKNKALKEKVEEILEGNEKLKEIKAEKENSKILEKNEEKLPIIKKEESPVLEEKEEIKAEETKEEKTPEIKKEEIAVLPKEETIEDAKNNNALKEIENKEENPVLDEKEEVEVKAEVIKAETNSKKEIKEDIKKLTKEDFKNNYINAAKTNYTINIASLANNGRVNKFIETYGLKDKAFVFSVSNDVIKVMYGNFKTRAEAVSILSKLPNKLKESNKPYLQKIFRVQDMYNKYHGKKEKEENTFVIKKEEVVLAKKETKEDAKKNDALKEITEELKQIENKEEKLLIIKKEKSPILDEKEEIKAEVIREEKIPEIKKEEVVLPKKETKKDLQKNKAEKENSKILEKNEEKLPIIKKEESPVLEEKEEIKAEEIKEEKTPEIKKEEVKSKIIVENTLNQESLKTNENKSSNTKLNNMNDTLLEKEKKENIIEIKDINDIKDILDANDEKVLVKEKKEIKNLDSKKYLIYIDTVNKNKLEWFLNRYQISEKNLIIKENKNVLRLYLGVYSSKEKAQKAKGSLHPRLRSTKVILSKD